MITADEALDNSLGSNKQLLFILADIQKLSLEGKTQTDWIKCDIHCISLLEHLGFKINHFQGFDRSEIRVSW